MSADASVAARAEARQRGRAGQAPATQILERGIRPALPAVIYLVVFW